MTIAGSIFDGRRAECELEGLLDEAGAEYERLGFDDYDNSIELYDVPPDHRLPEAAQRVLKDAGFSKAFVNHTDKWETHYGWAVGGEFAPQDGWRVSYPHKRGEGGGSILVEVQPASWPQDWFNNGRAKVVSIISSGERG